MKSIIPFLCVMCLLMACGENSNEGIAESPAEEEYVLRAFEDFSGTYELYNCPMMKEVSFFVENDTLFGQPVGRSAVPMKRFAEYTFFNAYVDVRFTFVPSQAKGPIDSLILRSGGVYAFEGKRKKD